MGGVEERHLQMVNSLRAVNSQQESKASGIPGADTPSPPRTSFAPPKARLCGFPLGASLQMKSPNACCISELLLPDTLPLVIAQKSHVGWEVALLRAARGGRLGASPYACGQPAGGCRPSGLGQQVGGQLFPPSAPHPLGQLGHGGGRAHVRERGKVHARFSTLPLWTSLRLCHW